MVYILKKGDFILFEYIGKGKEVWLIKSIRKSKENTYNIDAKVLKRGIDYRSEKVNSSMRNGFSRIPTIDIDKWKTLTGMSEYKFTLLDENDAILEVL